MLTFLTGLLVTAVLVGVVFSTYVLLVLLGEQIEKRVPDYGYDYGRLPDEQFALSGALAVSGIGVAVFVIFFVGMIARGF